MRKIIAGISRFFTPRISKIFFICMIIALTIATLNPLSEHAKLSRAYLMSTFCSGDVDLEAIAFSLAPFHSLKEFPIITSFYFVRYLKVYGLKVLLALPFGLAVPYAFPTKRYIWILFSLYFVVIEFLQPLFLIGYCDIDTILYYLLGYALGILIATLIRRMEQNTAVSLPSKQKK